MSNFTRRDFLKGSAALGVGFVSVGGILVPRNSEAASPLLGIFAVALYQVFMAYLAHRDGRQAYAFQNHFLPYNHNTTTDMGIGNVVQTRLYSENTHQPIQNFTSTKTASDPSYLMMKHGTAHMSNLYQEGQYNPAELELTRRYEQETGYGVFPKFKDDGGKYHLLTKHQMDYLKERTQDKSYKLNQFGELGVDYHVIGTRPFQNDMGKNMTALALKETNNPTIIRNGFV